MIEILAQAVNATGQTILKTNRRGWDQLVTVPRGQTPAEWLADARLDEEVMAAGEGVIAVQDLATGHARAFLHPAHLDNTPRTAAPTARVTKTPGAGRTGTVPGVTPDVGATLNPTRRSVLEQQLFALKLIVDDSMSSEGARRMAAADVAVIEELLQLADTPGT